MSTKLVPPDLGRLEEEVSELGPDTQKPNLKLASRRPEPKVGALIEEGFVTQAAVPEPPDPGGVTEVLTVEIPRRVKRALLAEVAERRDDPNRRAVASMKSVILEALSAYGFEHLIKKADIEVQAGIFMKRQAANLKRQ